MFYYIINYVKYLNSALYYQTPSLIFLHLIPFASVSIYQVLELISLLENNLHHQSLAVFVGLQISLMHYFHLVGLLLMLKKVECLNLCSPNLKHQPKIDKEENKNATHINNCANTVLTSHGAKEEMT